MKQRHMFLALLLVAFVIVFLVCYKEYYKNKEIAEISDRLYKIINESNYYLGTSFVGKVNYKIYKSKNTYLYRVTTENDLDYYFYKYDNTLFYMGHSFSHHDDFVMFYSDAITIYSPSKPDYSYENADYNLIDLSPDVYLICESIKNNYSSNGFYSIYLIDKYWWDRSPNHLYRIMIIQGNQVFFTQGRMVEDGWNITTPGCLGNIQEFAELIDKYKDNAIYYTHSIDFSTEVNSNIEK